MDKLKFFLSFLSESDGQLSSMRIIFVIGQLVAMILGFICYFYGHDVKDTLMLICGVASQFGLMKIVQNYQEEKK